MEISGAWRLSRPSGAGRFVSSTNNDLSDVNLDRVEELPVAIGQPVRVGEGPLAGSEGVVADIRSSGRYLVQLYQGVYIETRRVTLCQP